MQKKQQYLNKLLPSDFPLVAQNVPLRTAWVLRGFSERAAQLILK